MSKIRVGIIGTGNISHFHMKGYKELERDGIVELVAACDIDAEKLANYASQYGFQRTYTDYNEMMEKEELDCVSVCTWNAAHKGATVAALRGGANVLCEKPMAMNAAEAEEMIAASKESGKLLQIGFVRRFGKDADIVNQFRDSGALGDIYFAKATYLRRDGCPGGWFGDKRYSGGGPLIDLGVHVIDLTRYLAGGPKPVCVFGKTYNNLGCRRAKGGDDAWEAPVGTAEYEYSVEDFATALVTFDNGLTLNVEASFNLNLERDIGNVELFGTKAGLKLDPGVELYTDMAGRYVNIKPTGDTGFDMNAFVNEIKSFVNASQGKETCRATGEDGRILMQILDAIYESAATGKSVDIK